jgi:UDP-N-acetyl-D-mannosaminouronate:lipid I N-acetyl-D-mannosaminouronosyltransferase
MQKVKLRNVEVYPFGDVDELISFADEQKGILVAVNAEKMIKANEQTLSIINSNIAYCDGSAPVLAMHQLGYKQVKKIAGCELWLEIIKRHYLDKSFYIIGAKPEVHAEVIKKLKAEFPGINIVGARDGYLKTAEDRQALIDDVAEKRPDVVFVAMGSPTQEILMSDMLKRHKAIYQGLGGSYDVYTGRIRRAPRWFIDNNIEFVYRFIEQPKRFKREIIKLKFAWWLLWRKF